MAVRLLARHLISTPHLFACAVCTPAQLQAQITELRSELNKLKPKHTQLLEEREGADKARQDAEKARDDALAHLQELQRQGADEDSSGLGKA